MFCCKECQGVTGSRVREREREAGAAPEDQRAKRLQSLAQIAMIALSLMERKAMTADQMMNEWRLLRDSSVGPEASVHQAIVAQASGCVFV